MKTIGIVSEYNPFHLGHYHQIKESLQKSGAQGVIALMSGSLTQRGEFSFFNKWEKSRLALSAGVDLVVELPVVFAGQSAEYFSFGAVRILELCGVCDFLCFGSESGDLHGLLPLSQVLADEPPAFKENLKLFLAQGHSFAKARELAVQRLLGASSSKLLQKPNNILGIEYLKALKRLNSKIEPVTIKRIGAEYHSLEDSNFLSATAIRNILTQFSIDQNQAGICKALDQKLPYPAKMLLPLLENVDFSGKQKMLDALRLLILNDHVNALKAFPDVSEGLEHKIKDALKTEVTYDDLLSAIISKRIPKTRVQRILTNRMLNLKKADLDTLNKTTPYLRILGFNQTGREILKKIKNKEQIIMINNLRKEMSQLDDCQKKMIHYDIRATDLQNQFFEKNYCYHRDFFTNPLHI
ncbi:nucleotidyltransferase family protein [Eubacteriaceae bacterium ES2]|nr:nucleotidyltransferase family protein [Eubacteriaceae bacterium ES2]